MSVAAQLFDLQIADLELDGLAARLVAIERLLADSEAVLAARAAGAEAGKKLATAHGALVDAELALSQHEEHMANVQRQLYGGSVRNPKELQSLQREGESLARQQDRLESVTLELMEQDEAAQAVAQAAHAAQARAEAADSAAHALLRAEAAAINGRLPALAGQRAALAALVPGSVRGVYETLRRDKGGHAVAKLEHAACMACGVSMSTGEAQHARAAAAYGLAYCPNCNRILFAGH